RRSTGLFQKTDSRAESGNQERRLRRVRILIAVAVVVGGDHDGGDDHGGADQQDRQRNARELAAGVGIGADTITHANDRAGGAGGGGLASDEQQAHYGGGDCLTHA